MLFTALNFENHSLSKGTRTGTLGGQRVHFPAWSGFWPIRAVSLFLSLISGVRWASRVLLRKREEHWRGGKRIKAVLGFFKLLWFLLSFLRMREWPLEGAAQWGILAWLNKSRINAYYIRVSQPYHNWHFGLNNFLFWKTSQCSVGCLAAPLVSTH